MICDRSNIILMTDSYKFTHWKQYPPKTQFVYSYFESRGGKWHDVVFFGLQYLLRRYLEGSVVTQRGIEEAESLIARHLGSNQFNREGWEYILHRHDGHLPVRIRAVPEGSVVPAHNVLMTVENTDPKCYWLTNYLETLLVQTWYPCTVATQSREMKALLLKYLRRTGDPELIDFKLHDFGYRGVSSHETAGIGGAAHLVNFRGTDTFAGITMAMDYYYEPMAGFSIPAAEHSTITSWGRDHEEAAMTNMLQQYPEGAVAVVSDSFNIFEACESIWGGALREKVLGRNGVLVVRPDSGDPPDVLASGSPNVLSILAEKFGATRNDKGYLVLNPKIRVIQGDGIDIEMMDRILYAMQRAGFSADNVAFGSGGGLLQKLNRDTLKFAFKCSSIVVNNVARDVYKSPITDHGKASKHGRLHLVHDQQQNLYRTVRQGESTEPDYLTTVFDNGHVLREWTFSEIRDRARLLS